MKTNKVVYNNCYGGYELSLKAIKRYYELKYPGTSVYFYIQKDLASTEYSKLTDLSFSPKIRLIDIYFEDLGKSFDSLDIRDKNKISVSEFMETIPRHDPYLVSVVEELGEESNGPYSDLCVKDIGESTKYHIDDYDGCETVTIDLPEDYWVVIE